MQNNSKHMVIDDRFLVGRKLGNGNFGEIRLAKDKNTGKYFAVKMESSQTNNRQLYLENRYYRNIHSNKKESGIPMVYYYGLAGRFYTLVMDLLGPSIEELFEKTSRKFSIKTVTQIAIQTIRLMQVVHSHKIVYRDVKPENFLIGRDKSEHGKVYIVDFGLSKEYVNQTTGDHIMFREHKSLTGTARYMSINTHLGREQSRRDDMESLGHMLFYLLRGNLPWQGLKADSLKERYQMIGEVKRTTPVTRLCDSYPVEFGNYLIYTRGLDFYQEPNYEKLISSFKALLTSMNLENDGIMDWMCDGSFETQEIPQDDFPESTSGNDRRRSTNRNVPMINDKNNSGKNPKNKINVFNCCFKNN